MANDEYWKNRQAQMMYEQMEDAEAVSKELADLYAKASRDLNYRIENIYEKYRDKWKLTDEEAKTLLNATRGKADIQSLQEALANLPDSEGKAELLQQLESPAYRARIERLQNLQDEIDGMMQNVYDQEKRITTSHYIDLGSEAYYHQIYAIQKQVGFQFSFSAVDPKMFDKILRSKWSGKNYSDSIWGNTQDLAKDLKEQLLIELLTGKRLDEVAQDINQKYAVGAYKARRIVRTESNFVSGQMQLNAYEDCDAEYYEFVATLDLRTSEICRSLDGQKLKVSEAQPGKNMNPMHPFCRSTTIISLDGPEMEGLQRRARNPVTGKNELVPADTKYPDWYDKNVKNNPKAQAAEKMIKNRESDRKQYKAYSEALGAKEAGKSFESFQDMKYNEPEKWEDVKAFRKYKEKYPDSSRKYYNIQRDLKIEGIDKGVCLPARGKKAYILPDPKAKRDASHIMKRMMERHITDDELRSFVDNSKVMFSQWGGDRQMFITEDGVSVLSRAGDDWVFKTGWKKEDFDEETLTILEVMAKYGK